MHHITSDLLNLSMHSDYVGNNDIVVGNGNSISISHIGSTTVDSNTQSFTLDNVLCAPQIQKNLIFVSQFCKQNNTFIEFFPYSFVVKDLNMGTSLAKGWSKYNLYEWSSSMSYLTPTSLASIALSSHIWHQWLRHPSAPIQHKIMPTNKLSS